jgi:hypothetical protein
MYSIQLRLYGADSGISRYLTAITNLKELANDLHPNQLLKPLGDKINEAGITAAD